MEAFIGGLRGGRFPKLERLGLGNLTVDTLRDFVDALVAMAGGQAPARLANVELQGRTLTVPGCMEALAAAFEADALPNLVEVYMNLISNAEDLEGACALWRALGDKVKLEGLRAHFHDLRPKAKIHVLQAMADPGFCPFLREVPYAKDDKSIIDVAASLAERRRKWNQLAQAPAPVPPAPAVAEAAAGGAGAGAGADDDDDDDDVEIVEPPAAAAAGAAGPAAAAAAGAEMVQVPANVLAELMARVQALEAQQQGGGGV